MRTTYDNDEDDEYELGMDDEDDDDTIPCPKCGKAMFDDSPRCPACGHYLTDADQQAERKPTWFIIAFLLALAVCLYWIWPFM
jgi:uncharacterized protein (DUF983 family)